MLSVIAAILLVLSFIAGSLNVPDLTRNSSEQIRAEYVELTEMVGYGTYRKPAETVIDNTEMALCIARSLAEQGEFDPGDIVERFVAWYNSGPFDIGLMTADALRSIDAGTSWETTGREVGGAAGGGGRTRAMAA